MRPRLPGTRPRPCGADLRAVGSALVLVLAALAAPAQAGRDARMPASMPAEYASACGDCHLAYPPALLPAGAWTVLMSGLDAHFGTDAQLDEAARARVADWLRGHAATGRRATAIASDGRITRTARFTRKHRAVGESVWRSPDVRTPANCAACHPRADQGDFDDDDVRVPGHGRIGR